MRRMLLLLCLYFAFTGIQLAQELERRPLMGIAYGPMEEHINKDLPRGVDIKMVVPKSSAEYADLRQGDIVIQYQGSSINSMLDFKTQMRNQQTGDKVSIKLIRDGEVITKKMTLTEFPREEHPDFETMYDQVEHNGNVIRSFVTKPKDDQKTFPAVYIIQGIGCSPVENPFKNKSGISSLVESLTQAGFVTMRMERSGVGDSQGTPCQKINFKADLKNFKAGLEKLKTYSFIDQDNVFMIGLSMGGIMAPIINESESVAGIVVYGTGGKDWYSYELENTFRQALLEGIPMNELNEYMIKEQKRLHYFFTEKKTPDEIKKIDQEMGERCESYPLNYAYFQEVADVDMYGLWSKCNTNVLAIHGNADFVSSGSEHDLIARMVNQNNPGKAKYVEFPEADHWMNKTASEKDSFQQKFDGINQELVEYITEWVSGQVKEKS